MGNVFNKVYEKKDVFVDDYLTQGHLQKLCKFTVFLFSANIKKRYELVRYFSLLSHFEVDELLFVASKKCLSKTGHKNVVLKERGFFYLL